MNKFVFIDESGVLTKDVNQPFFGIGILEIHDTSRLLECLKDIRAKLKGTEFKFSGITTTDYNNYVSLIDSYFRFPDCYYCAFVLDKFNPDIDVDRYFSNAWDAYVGYSKLLIKRNLGDDSCCIIADYLDRPKHASNYYEESIRSIGAKRYSTLQCSNPTPL